MSWTIVNCRQQLKVRRMRSFLRQREEAHNATLASSITMHEIGTTSTIYCDQLSTHKDIQNRTSRTPRTQGSISRNMDTIIDSRVKYRVGSPILPTLPVVTQPVGGMDSKFPNWVTHMERIGEILDEQGITPRYTNVAYRLHAGHECHARYITIVTHTNYKPESDSTWPSAVRQIRKYLTEAGVDLAVEIIALPLERGLKCLPFAKDTYQWNDELLPKVCALMADRQWTIISLVYQANIEIPGGMRPTIVIGARDSDNENWWDQVLPAVRHLVAHSDIQVQLLYCPQLLTNDPHPALLRQSFLSTDIHLGASCGTGTRTGTLGGRMCLKDRDTGKEITFGITNHHVLAHHLDGQGPFTVIEDPIKVESPSSSDRDAHVRESETWFNIQQKYNSDQVDAERELSRAQDFDSYVGHVFASSGYRTADSGKLQTWALDWCLTTVENRRIHSLYWDDSSAGRKEVKGYLNLDSRRGYRVFKKGRTSGPTAGFISATQSAIQLRTRVPEPEPGFTAPLQDIENFPGRPVRCHTLIADHRTNRKGEFIERGDSGSLILLDPKDCTLPEDPKEKESCFAGLLDEPTESAWEIYLKDAKPTLEVRGGDEDNEALIAGIAFAGSENSLISCMIPMDLVVQDIESVTGYEVVEPKLKTLGE